MTPEQPRKQRGKEIHKVVLPLAESLSNMPEKYISFFELLQKRIAKERLKTVLNANADMIMLYWHIGRALNELFGTEDWGTEIIDRMAHDLREKFPDIEGFSQRQLKHMQCFAEA